MPPPIRIVMLGTGDFALPTFEHLCSTGHEVIALVTQPDRPQGRDKEIIPSAIKQSAQARKLLVLQPEDVNSAEGVETIRSLKPDLLVTAAYGQILSAELLGIPTLGGINLHGSVLPAYRGASPVARAIQDGRSETGVTIIRMTPRIDAGGMIAVARTPIGPDETAGELEDRLARLGAPLVAEAITAIVAGTARVIPQDKDLVTRAPKLRKEDGIIDWTRPASAIHDHVRAMQPWPIASTIWTPAAPDGRGAVRLIIHKTRPVDDAQSDQPPGHVIEARGDRFVVAAGQGAVHLTLIQVPGKKPLTASEFLRGNRVQQGDLLGS